MFFFFKQKTAYEMRISDWSSDVCSSDLRAYSSNRPVSAHVRNEPGTVGMTDDRNRYTICSGGDSLPECSGARLRMGSQNTKPAIIQRACMPKCTTSTRR